MPKIKREEVIDEALKLLDEVGFEGVSTRHIADRLGVESASLYYHFKNKSELLNEMAAAVISRHHNVPLPESVADWRDFILANTRSFRNALLAHRDGAKLHAGSTPLTSEIEGILAKVAYLVRAGFTEHEAGMTLFSTSQFTIGCVLEEQASLDHASMARNHARSKKSAVKAPPAGTEMSPGVNKGPGAAEVFEFGLNLIVEGLENRRSHSTVS